MSYPTVFDLTNRLFAVRRADAFTALEMAARHRKLRVTRQADFDRLCAAAACRCAIKLAARYDREARADGLRIPGGALPLPRPPSCEPRP